jgi:hypothetical protein
MKKGDIVKLKPGKTLSKAELQEYLSGDSKELPHYTVKADASYQRVGCADEVELVVQFEETSKFDRFYADHFEVVLPAGQPDVNELMKQARELEVVPV